MRINKKDKNKNTYNFYYYYTVYCFTYILLYLHSLKTKKIVLIGSVHQYNRDYILYILGVFYLLYFTLHHFINKIPKEKLLLKSRIKTGFYLICVLFLIVYNQIDCTFLSSSFYIYQWFFFAIFGLLGLILPLLYYNQLFFFCGLLLILFINQLLKLIFGGKILILGYLQLISWKHWCFLLLLIVIHILSTIGIDIMIPSSTKSLRKKVLVKDKDYSSIVVENENANHSDHFIETQEFDEDNNVEIPIFSYEIIDSIYDTKGNKLSSSAENTPIDALGEQLLQILKTFSIQGDMYKQLKSYTVNNYFFKPQVGTKMSRIESIEEELSMEIGRNVRVTSSLQGVVFEVANDKIFSFSFKDIWELEPKEELPLFIGFDSLGKRVVIDLAKQPHILMCGTTGSGKSSTLQCLIHSLITSKPLDTFKFIFIDPKVLELSVYKSLPNLFCPIVTNLDNAAEVLLKLVTEMENRYKIISQANQRSIKEYNKKMDTNPLPYLVCVIEEFADLALHKNSSFKNSVQRLAQMGRAAGIHLIIATQRPSVNVIDGVIKANFPTRIGLKVANKMESRIILDQSGAERMSGPGEMILLDGTGLTRRVIAPYISEDEMNRLMEFIKTF